MSLELVCDTCGTVLRVADGPLNEVVSHVRKVGWTMPTPFSNRCQTCPVRGSQ